MALLTQFLLRLSFGLAVGMAMTSPKLVSSGYFRNHLYVTLGLTTLASIAAMSLSTTTAWLSGAAAVSSYVGSACWLYESKRFGTLSLWFVGGLSLVAAWSGAGHWLLQMVGVATSGLVLGLTMAAMLLGHWYLNSPGMELAPLRRLLMLMVAAIAAQALVSAIGLAGHWASGDQISLSWLLFVLMRWMFGLIGVSVLIGMAWQTLKIPNTQSATGILYVGVIGVFVGELTGLLLSAESAFPL